MGSIDSTVPGHARAHPDWTIVQRAIGHTPWRAATGQSILALYGARGRSEVGPADEVIRERRY
jgi:hypothetical protein